MEQLNENKIRTTKTKVGPEQRIPMATTVIVQLLSNIPDANNKKLQTKNRSPQAEDFKVLKIRTRSKPVHRTCNIC